MCCAIESGLLVELAQTGQRRTTQGAQLLKTRFKSIVHLNVLITLTRKIIGLQVRDRLNSNWKLRVVDLGLWVKISQAKIIATEGSLSLFIQDSVRSLLCRVPVGPRKILVYRVALRLTELRIGSGMLVAVAQTDRRWTTESAQTI